MRTIPATMATQHPDNAQAPYWDAEKRPFIAFHQEVQEAVACFKDLDVDEFMWDWEGKHADAAVIDRLFSDYYDYFKDNQLGQDKFLTFRIPNVWEEKGYSLLQAMTVVLTGEDFAHDLKFQNRPLFEVILPMTERADQLTHMQELFEKLARFKNQEFTPALHANSEYLEMIPLVESVESQQSIGTLLDQYVAAHEQHFGRQPAYIRPFLARSDPALVSGLLATVIANKLALARSYEFSARHDIPVFPVSGVGSLPFRGGLSPETVDAYLNEYPGMRTVSIQSSFRYDHPLDKVKAALKKLEHELPKAKPYAIAVTDQTELGAIGAQAATVYQETLGAIAADVMPVFSAVPKRRDRRQHIGLLAYGRSMGEHKMPRAITFTGGFYSIGVPPEFIGFGRALKDLTDSQIDLVRREYKNLQTDLETAGHYLNRENLHELGQSNATWQLIEEDIEALESILNIKLGPKTADHEAHADLSRQVLHLKNDKNKNALRGIIAEMAGLRKSIG